MDDFIGSDNDYRPQGLIFLGYLGLCLEGSGEIVCFDIILSKISHFGTLQIAAVL